MTQAQTPRIRFATAQDGVRIAYAVTGEGPALVYMTGWVSHLELDWLRSGAPFFERLGRSRRLIRYDCRGSGLSDRSVDDVSLPARLKDLEAVVEHLRLEQFSIFAWSHGSPAAMVYAAEHPERVAQLVLYAPFCEGYAKGGDREAVARALIALIRAEWGVGAKTTVGFISPDADREEERQTLAYLAQSASGEVAAKILEEGMFHTDVSDRVGEIAAPTLVMHRREDNAVPMECGRRVASLLPNARFLPLAGTYHVPMFGDMEPLLRAVDEFLSGEAVPPADVEQPPPLAPAPAGAPVTILFTDMEGSTPLTQRLGDASAQEVLRTHNTIVRDALRAHSGSEIKHTGDGIMASFPSASGAVECAIEIQRSIASHDEQHPDAPLGVRIGLNAGEPVAEGEDLFGTAVQAASRICERAQPGQILVSDVVRQLAAGKSFNFTERGRVLLKGFRERIRLFEVSWG